MESFSSFKRKRHTPQVDVPGTVYLIHFDKKLAHAGHYIGWSQSLSQRLMHHRNGTGSALMRAVTHAGIDFKVAKTWEGVTRAFERELHNKKNTARICPLCQAAKEKNKEE
jgi:predicted GIY-YIG superfamily endonuclease